LNNKEEFNEMSKGFDFGQAITEADRCLLCHDAPCSKGCPADTDPAGFIRKLRLKNITGAVRTIKRNNILGGVCSVLCPASDLCEKACSASGIGRPVEIGKIQRFLIEYAWKSDFNVFEKPEQRKERVAVIGSGPAGLTCSAELAKKGFKVTVFEARPEPGGVLRYGIAPYRLNKEFLERELEDVKKFGVEFKLNSRIQGKAGAESLLDHGFDAVFIGTGLWGAGRLKPEKENYNGVYNSIDYLSALHDDDRLTQIREQIKGKRVAVIGGGAVAIDCVESAAKLEASDVYLIYRRSFLQMNTNKDEIVRTLEAGVHYLLLNQPVDYVADEKNRIKGLKIKRTRLGAEDVSGRRSPEIIDGSEWILDTDIVIEAIGNIPEKDSFQLYPNVKINDKKLIQTDPETMQTLVKGVFAGGDIVRGPSFVVNAVCDGKAAARAIKAYLDKKQEVGTE